MEETSGGTTYFAGNIAVKYNYSKMNQKLQYFQFNMDINETKTKKRGRKRPILEEKINVERVRIFRNKKGGKRPNSGRKINVERVRISFIVIKDKGNAEKTKKTLFKMKTTTGNKESKRRLKRTEILLQHLAFGLPS